MRLMLTLDRGFHQWAGSFAELAEKAPTALSRALFHEGAKAKVATQRALAKQTNLKYGLLKRAVREVRGEPLTYTLESAGGNLRLKWFGGAREVRGGVIARPWNRSTLYAGAFTRGGQWPRRVPIQKLGGHAFQRTGGARLPISQVRSGLFIPTEMIEGASAAAFEATMGVTLEKRVAHELARFFR